MREKHLEEIRHELAHGDHMCGSTHHDNLTHPLSLRQRHILPLWSERLGRLPRLVLELLAHPPALLSLARQRHLGAERRLVERKIISR